MDDSDLELRRGTYVFFVENLLRSEKHIARWLGALEPGATISVAKLSELAHSWWDDRVSPAWQPRTRERNQAILERLGAAGAFWQLP